ncbi:MAG: hypothetical protein PWR12_2095 [Eubacteriaceae bacterium]|nr:hypothetical protein [Eubacteriaceae bacterium]MDK2961864.1 hypothetical protein [Eubacteriaceae bacterium]MDN5289898.1 hypothetical protein [Anaerophaga sp.]
MQLTHDEWLGERRKGIGGSDAAAIIGLNPWSTPYSVWADKTGRIPAKDDNEIMRQGRDLEQYVADRWMEATGKRCRRRTKILSNPKYPFALANVDRWVVGENAGLECKTTSSMNLKKYKGGEFPDNYYVQCVHYMAVTNADRWYLSVVILGKEHHTFTIERDEEEIQALMESERSFWQFVESDTPPPVDGLDPTTNTINAVYPDTNGESLDLFGQESDIKRYQQLKAEIKDLEKEKELIEQSFKEQLKDFETGHCGIYTVNWKSRQRNSFQAKEFANDHPDMELDGYYKKSKYRVFDIKEAK